MSNNQEKLNEQLFNVVADEKVSDEARLKKVKYLVRLGADVNARFYGKSVLSKAIEQNAGAEVVEFLREKGAIEWVISKEEAKKLSQGFWDDRSNLKSLEEIKQLLKKGADVNAKDEWSGETALFVVARWGHIEVVKYLAECGADLEAKDESGRTALIGAAKEGQIEVVKYLAEKGADVDAKDEWYGETALMKAARDGNLDMVKCLAEYGAQLDIQDKNGWTALITAVYEGQVDVVKYLVEHGADLEVKCENCEIAKEVARNWKRDDCLMILEEAQKKSLTQKGQSAKTGASTIVKKNEGR